MRTSRKVVLVYRLEKIFFVKVRRIHKAVNRGVKFEIHDEEAVDEFYALYEETGKRSGFPVREKEYFTQMLSAFGSDCKIFLCRSENGEPLSAAVGISDCIESPTSGC